MHINNQMEKKGRRRRRSWHQWPWMLGFSAMAAHFLFFSLAVAAAASEEEGHSSPQRLLRKLVESKESMSLPQLTLQTQTHGQVVMDNGLVQITLSNPDGDVIGIKYNGINNLLEILNENNDRGYWDVVWNRPNRDIMFERLRGTNFKVITANSEQLEVSFTKTWNPSSAGSSVPLNVDKRYILRRGDSGFYAYAVFERLDGWPQIEMDQIRIVYKLRKEKFHYMAISEERQRIMPMPEDRMTGQPLAYKEAVLLTQPINSDLKGEVDDKYQYSMENEENAVHGWVCTNPPVGFWIITPSNEFRNAGPVKQDLTSHVGPITLAMFVSTHYGGKEVGMRFEEGEPWKKVFGPVFVYLNSVPTGTGATAPLWADAKNQMGIEVSGWPYSFAESGDFLTSDQRGSVTGQLLVRDRYATNRLMWADSAYVGLAAPGELGSWQRESKGYQFWTRADGRGYFSIKNVSPGNYNLYAWVPGVLGDYKYNGDVTVTPGSFTGLSMLVFSPPRRGPTLWEIGIPDRTAAEFYVPDPYPTLMNRLYNNQNSDKFRQYGLWERYADLYPTQDLVYTVGVDDYRRHWFFAHVTRAAGSGTYSATTWQIVFRLEGAKQTGNYTLRLALASATESVVEVRFNDQTADPAHFSTGPIGMDNAIARHGIHGLYWLFSIDVPSEYLVEDKDNVIYLTQARHRGPFQGVMYDYIRLEGVL